MVNFLSLQNETLVSLQAFVLVEKKNIIKSPGNHFASLYSKFQPIHSIVQTILITNSTSDRILLSVDLSVLNPRSLTLEAQTVSKEIPLVIFNQALRRKKGFIYLRVYVRDCKG